MTRRILILYGSSDKQQAWGNAPMFSTWGRFIYRFRRPVAILAIILAVASMSLASQVTGALSAGGWTDPDSESAAVTDRLKDEFGAGGGAIIAVFRGDPGDDARSTSYQDEISGSLDRLIADPRVSGTVGWAETHDDRFISTDGTSAYVVVQLAITDEAAVDEMPALRALIDQPTDLTLQLTGVGPATQDQAEQSERELIQAETVSFPFAALILILVFASLVAAGLPLLVAGLAIPTTLGGVYLAAQATELSIYVQNVATMLGLALAIDYSLFMVSRFREELRRGRDVASAVEITVATSGKAVTFSGLAVAVGLSGLLLFQPSALRSFGIGGALVVAASVFYALTFLPAVLGMLGPRVNALSVAGLRDGVRRLLGRPVGAAATVARESRWERMAHRVMARPFAVLVPTLAFLLVLGTPFLHLSQGIPDASVLPPGIESREASVALSRDFRAGETSPIIVLATVQGSPTDEANVQRILDLSAAIDRVADVDRVEGPFVDLKDPATGAELDAAGIATLFAAPRDQLPRELATGLDRLEDSYIRGSTVRLDAISPLAPLSPAGTQVVPAVRAVNVDGVTTQVGGLAAQGKDFMASQSETIPWAIALTLGASAVILFLLFGSVIIPIKAVIMTLLSITASFGALVFIFQDGNFADILGFTTPGFTIAGNPIIMFSVLFGLSMDYEVLLLSRIQEAYRRTGDNTASVAEGLVKTAGVITGAALIMVTVFSAFALAESITIKSIGVGMAIAVLIDATIVRVLLVPATMRLMGRWNWWAPGPLGRLADRLGFSHVEDEVIAPARVAQPAG
ncbi:MAG TPA: MMPL family transporter [Candidatus Limnocylindrales bacterium]|nr:MMPL family transporter [Candidatus Limnocylindrales bacterium]